MAGRFIEDSKISFTDLEVQIQPQRDRGLKKAGVKLCHDEEVVGLTHRDLAVASGERRPVGLAVNASFRLPTVALSDQCLRWPFEIEDDLSLKAYQNIWVTAMKKQTTMTAQLALPGLERNLRILMDWVLDIPFRSDIAVLAPDPTERLQRAHFEPGDEVIRQGDEGETAYVITSGRVEVLQDGNKPGELGDGDSFGEIALLSNVRRTATVRCLTACELTVLARDDFRALTTGFGSLAEAIRKQAVKF